MPIVRQCLGFPGHRCGQLIPASQRRCASCSSGANRVKEARRPTGEREFYRSPAWRALRTEVLAEADGCYHCGRRDVELSVDHVETLRHAPELALDRDNVVASCRSCQLSKQYHGGGRGDG